MTPSQPKSLLLICFLLLSSCLHVHAQSLSNPYGDFEGRYKFSSKRYIVIKAENGRIYAWNGRNKAELLPETNLTFQLALPVLNKLHVAKRFVFKRDANGNITELTVGTDRAVKVK